MLGHEGTNLHFSFEVTLLAYMPHEGPGEGACPAQQELQAVLIINISLCLQQGCNTAHAIQSSMHGQPPVVAEQQLGMILLLGS